MRLLLDTHIILWAFFAQRRLPAKARVLLEDERNELVFSAVNLWEISIKRALGRSDFRVDPSLLYRSLKEQGYIELPITCEHTISVDSLPPIHKDPFDRLLLAQALLEGIPLLTADPVIARYPGPIRKV
ncbi:MAG: type II toxin-antitoxin system VapC family toxin [Acidobacteriaceae bacterium]|nr:type II toxin-antitoxin system VapC family toxin [Acidobacteriaceae bacterium]